MEGYPSGSNDPNTPLTDLSTVKEKETHRKRDKWLQRENHRKMSEDLSGKG
jgi:hypothetical protein